jgi:hypothetical protein
LKTEDREELFGEIAKKEGFITWPQLRQALETQIKETIKGEVRFIGEILCDLNFMTELQAREVLEFIDKGATGNG